MRVEKSKFVFQVLQEEAGLAQLVEVFCNEGYNKNAKLHYLSALLSNLTQLPEARSYIMDKDRWLTAQQDKSWRLTVGHIHIL